MASFDPPRVHPAVQVFVLFHMFMVFAFALPPRKAEEREQVQAGKADVRTQVLYGLEAVARDRNIPTSFYMYSTGLWQSWDMFAPNPASTDIWRDSLVTFADGTQKVHAYPRMKALPIPQKYVMERFRKYNERLNDDGYGWKWRHTSYRIAYEAWKDPNNPPVRVEMRRHWMVVQPPPNLTPEVYQTYRHWEERISLPELRKFSTQ